MAKVMLVAENNPYEPLGIGYLASALKKKGHNVKFSTLDNAIVNHSDFQPEIIGYSVLTGSQDKFVRLAKLFKFKNKDSINIVGGPHPTYFPEISEEKDIDYVVRGEGEITLNEIIETKPSQKVILGKLVHDLDTIGFPDREIIYDEMKKERTNPIKHAMASRGCPYSCPYCYNDGLKKLYKGEKIVRWRSPENVTAEISELMTKYGAKFIHFQDDAFTANKDWLYNFLIAYERDVKLPFHAIVRLEQLNEEIIRNLKSAGLHSVRTALESGNDYLRTEVLKRKISKEQVKETCLLLHKYDIKFLLQNMLGLPEGDLSMDLETLELNKEVKPTYAWASIFQPYPGTELGDKHKIKLDGIKSNFYESSPLPIKDKQAREELRKNFANLVNGKTYQQANEELYAGFLKID